MNVFTQVQYCRINLIKKKLKNTLPNELNFSPFTDANAAPSIDDKV